MTTAKKIISGVTVGSLLGSLATLLYPRRDEIMDYMREHSDDFNNLKDIAKEYGSTLLNKRFRKSEDRSNYWKIGLAGLLVGAGTALLLAPKAGKSLRGQLSKAYNDISEKSEELIHEFKNGAHHPFSSLNIYQNGIKRKKAAASLKSKKKKTPSRSATHHHH
jgi:gas vesicle protein